LKRKYINDKSKNETNGKKAALELRINKFYSKKAGRFRAEGNKD
jgi:hypothetical protein